MKAISYLRVSTNSQGVCGLGMEAQRSVISEWARSRPADLVREFVEVESGRKAKRPVLQEALDTAKKLGYVLVVAKLDRLSRDVDVVRSIAASGVDVVFCDFPQIPDGPMGRFMLTALAAVAEFEAGLISQRTKAALAAAKARGVKLGNPNGAACFRRYHAQRDKPHDQSAGVEAARLSRLRARERREAVLLN